MERNFDPRFIDVTKIKSVADGRIIEKELLYKIGQIEDRCEVCYDDEIERAEAALDQCRHKLEIVREKITALIERDKERESNNNKNKTAESLAKEKSTDLINYITERTEHLRKFYYAAKEMLPENTFKQIQKVAKEGESK